MAFWGSYYRCSCRSGCGYQSDVVAGCGLLTALTFTSLAFAFSRSGHTIVAAILAAGAWLFGAFAVLVWFWR